MLYTVEAFTVCGTSIDTRDLALFRAPQTNTTLLAHNEHRRHRVRAVKLAILLSAPTGNKLPRLYTGFTVFHGWRAVRGTRLLANNRLYNLTRILEIVPGLSDRGWMKVGEHQKRLPYARVRTCARAHTQRGVIKVVNFILGYGLDPSCPRGPENATQKTK